MLPAESKSQKFPDGCTLQQKLLLQDAVYAIAWSPHGRLLALGSRDHTIRLWETLTGKEHRALIGHSGWVYSIAWSPDGRTLASTSEDTTVRFWDVKTGEQRQVLETEASRVRGVAWSPNGQI